MKQILNILLISFLLGALYSCQKEEYITSPKFNLTYSIDTIKFDTIFSEKGSITRSFKVFNPHKGIITINKISIPQQNSLEYFINVNGQSAKIIENIDIAPGDSLFVFVQAKLNKNNVDTAILHMDSLVFEYNTISDNIILSAWGQDVQNYKGTILPTTTFTSKIPYVIYDSLVIPEGETLTIESGTRIYMHYNANIIVHGTLLIQGTLENPVSITSDRLEETYQLLPGQWGSIIFTETSKNNSINYANIKNGTNGILTHNNSTNRIDFTISNSKFYNMSSNIIYALNSNFEIFNSVFLNCNNFALAIQGGKIHCNQSTISNEGTIGFRNGVPSISISNYNLENDNEIPLDEAFFYNSIIVGQIKNEIMISTLVQDDKLNCKFDYCLLKDIYSAVDSSYYGKNYYYDDTKNLFNNTSFNDYSLDTLSQAQNKGLLQYANTHTTDIQGNSRIIDTKPDIGAYEYFYDTKE